MSDLLESWEKKESIYDTLDKLRLKLKPAELQGKTECVKCGYCCHQRACIPTPFEFLNICEFLELTPEEAFKKYFVIDYYGGLFSPINDSTKFIFPAAKDQTPGKLLTDDETFTTVGCIFLDENNHCKIYKVRPQTARKMECWVKVSRGEAIKDLSKVVATWKNVDFKELINYEVEE